MVLAVVLLALNLRPAVNALGVVIPELQDATGLSSTTAGVLLALPTMCFAVIGFVAPAVAGRLGSHLTVVLSLVALTAGQLVRAVVGGTGALFAGSILALAGIAIGNVLLPGLVRLHFPSAITPMTALYTTVLMAGQTLGAGITLPLEHAMGGSWRLGIGMWAVTAGIALVPWVTAAARHPRPRRGARAARDETATGQRPRGTARPDGQVRVMALFRSLRAWSLAAFFGVQSLHAYVIFGWLASVLTTAGLSGESAAGMLAIVTAVGIPISAVVPALLGALRRQEILVIAFVACMAIAYLWFLAIPTRMTWIPSMLLGLGFGSFPMGLTLMALRSRTHSGTTALAGFSQSVGYLIASFGPVGFGFLHDVSGGWQVPLVTLTCTLVVMLAGGIVAARRWEIEDELAGGANPKTPESGATEQAR